MAFTDLGRYFQAVLYQGVDGNVITQFKQLVLGKAFHVSSFPDCVRTMVIGLMLRRPGKFVRKEVLNGILPQENI